MNKYFVIVILIISSILLFYVYFMHTFDIDKINTFLNLHCTDNAILNPGDFIWSNNFRNNWKLVRHEFDQYYEKTIIPEYSELNEIISKNTNGWKTLFLRAFNNDTKIIDQFPITKGLLNMCPCTTAYFSILEPNARIDPHVGIYKGVIRYHLGLYIPKNWNDCFINVDGINLYWQEGEDLLFDDMYDHYVENNTDEQRIILFLDIKRDFGNIIINAINSVMLRFISCNDITIDLVDKVNKLSI